MLANAEANLIFHDDDWVGVSEPAKDLIRRILVSNPANRLSTSDVMQNAWVVSHIADPSTGHTTLPNGDGPLDRRRLQMSAAAANASGGALFVGSDSASGES